jgi:DNA-binding HxlR family transcriptional regulator
MSRKRLTHLDCSIAHSLDQIGDWWTLLIVREAFLGISTFSAFQSRLGIAKNILTNRLDYLVDVNVLERLQPRSDTARFEYHLTDKGRDLMPLLAALMQWGDRWLFGPGKEPLEVVDVQSHQRIAQLQVTNTQGHAVPLSHLRFRPGPGASEKTRQQFEELRERRRTKAAP